MIREREISCTELTQACLARAEAYNPIVNAFITIMHEEALAQAGQLDVEASAGNFRGPLHGIPIGLKDNIDTAGTRTTGGSLVFEENVPEEDGFVVKRLKESGAVIMAKAGLQEFAMGYEQRLDVLPTRPQPLGARPDHGRLFRGLGRRSDRRHDPRSAGHRHRWLGPHARRLLRHRRPQAHVWPGLHRGDHSAHILTGPLRSDDKDGGRFCLTPVRNGGVRQA